MLYINTKKNDKTIINIEALFTLKYSEIKECYSSNKYVLQILEKIDGMKSYKDDVIDAKFGAVSLQDISMGSKACILAILYSKDYIISSDEMGYNCIEELAIISKDIDIRIYSSVPYSYFIDGVMVNIDGYECLNSDDVLDTMEALYE